MARRSKRSLRTLAFLALGAPATYGISSGFVRPFTIGVAGGTASGKSSVVSEVVRLLSHERVASITQDCFYRALTPEQHEAAMASEYNFDHPNAFNFDEQYEMLEQLRHGQARVELPMYDFVTHSRLSTTTTVQAPQIVIFEGLFTLYDERLRGHYDLKVFVDADADVRLSRRIRRDIAERGPPEGQRQAACWPAGGRGPGLEVGGRRLDNVRTSTLDASWDLLNGVSSSS